MACKILITVQDGITSTNGVYHLFKFKESYCYEGMVMKKPVCDDSCHKDYLVKHYIVKIDGEEYHVPESNAIITDLHYYEHERDHYQDHINRRQDKTKDYVKAAKDYLGITMKGDYPDGNYFIPPDKKKTEDNVGYEG